MMVVSFSMAYRSFRGGSGRLDTHLDTPPSINRRHPDSCLAPSTAEKAERLKALGASDVINYSEAPDWDERVRVLTDGRGVDCVVEISGPGTIAMSLKALAVGGHVSLIGASLSPAGAMLDPLLLTGRG